jgi:hypothetical protein
MKIHQLKSILHLEKRNEKNLHFWLDGSKKFSSITLRESRRGMEFGARAFYDFMIKLCHIYGTELIIARAKTRKPASKS